MSPNHVNKSADKVLSNHTGLCIDVDITKSVEENAGLYFEKAKKLKKKIEGALKALERFKKKLDVLNQKSQKEVLSSDNTPAYSYRNKEWYEKYRWFISSIGILVVGGRDSTTNEILIKKHTDPSDIVLHTDMAGSPFTVIKLHNKAKLEELSDEMRNILLQEAANFTVSYSKAWKKGMSSLEVFYVKPEQVTKTPNPGEFLAKGSFVIRGKVEYVLGKIDLFVGLLNNGRIMAGPKSAVIKNCENHIEIVQGKKKVSDIAKIIKKKFNYPDLDEIIRLLPAGGVDIK